ncbi:MAG: helix-turn-helix domain-containing protein, partial [Candidatus Scatosoma sp.]
QKYIVASDCENLEHCLVYYINLLLNQNDSVSTQCNIQARFIQLLTELDKCLSLAGLTSTGIHYIAHAKLFIKNNFNRPLTVTEIAEHTGCTKSYLQRLFNTHIGMSVLQYLNNIRIAKCKRILTETNLSIDDICAHVGFNNRQHLIYEFKAQTGITPTAYRNSFDCENKMRHSPPLTEYISQKIKN